MPTIRRCCIIGCPSNSRHNPALQFFQFPKPENPFHKLWKNACHASLSRILPFKKPVVCALHFHPNCVGGRRLTSNAVPSLRLEIPSNMKMIEQQAMVEEIERSRKCAYINAVVYEWLVRANLNAQLRGSITHGMIKEKAEGAKQLVGSDTFIVDNRWLNRFRETHLAGFAQKLAANQLKPLGPSLWIPDIVQDLQHLFPPTSAERMANFENVPEQYVNYMQQYGEYEEDDDMDAKEQAIQDQKYSQTTTQYQQQQQQQLLQQQQQQQYGNQSSYDSYGTNSFDMDNYYAERKSSHPQQLQQQQQHYNSWSHNTSRSNSPTQSIHGKHERVSSPPNKTMFMPKRPRLHTDDTDEVKPVGSSSSSANGKAEHQQHAQPLATPIDHIDITEGDDGPDDSNSNSAHYSNSNSNSNSNATNPTRLTISKSLRSGGSSSNNNNDLSSNNNRNATNGSGAHHGNSSIITGSSSNTLKIKKDITNGISRYSVASSTSGRTPSSSPAPSNSSKQGRSETNGNTTPVNDLKEIESYTDALEYLRPIEQFVLMQENFRAIGLLAQLEKILKNGETSTTPRRNVKH